MLAQTERPAVIVRRRLDQAGYDPVDGQELLGDNMSFLLKFVYKSQFLGPAVRHPRIIKPCAHFPTTGTGGGTNI